MKTRSLMLLGLAAGCGLLAMVLFQRASGSTGGDEQKVSVLVSIAEISPGTALNEKNCEFREYPISMVPDGAVTTPEEYEGRAVKVRTYPGDIIIMDKLSDGTGASNDIPAGMQVTSISVDKTMTHSGLLLPGDRVNVMVTIDIMHSAYSGLSKQIKTVLEFVEVFATDNRRDIDSANGESNTSTVSLLVTEEEAKLVKLAEAVGKLHLTLRSKDDTNPKSAPDDEKFRPSELVDYFNDGEEEAESGEGEEGDTEPVDTQPAPEPQPVIQEPPPMDDLTAFLDANMEAAPEPRAFVDPAPVQPAAPVPKMWKVEILAGDQTIVQEFPLPIDKSELPPKVTGNPIVDRLNSFFKGVRKPKKKKPVLVFDGDSGDSSTGSGDGTIEGNGFGAGGFDESDSGADVTEESSTDEGEFSTDDFNEGDFDETTLRLPLGS